MHASNVHHRIPPPPPFRIAAAKATKSSAATGAAPAADPHPSSHHNHTTLEWLLLCMHEIDHKFETQQPQQQPQTQESSGRDSDDAKHECTSARFAPASLQSRCVYSALCPFTTPPLLTLQFRLCM
jgi:hypothetical protein